MRKRNRLWSFALAGALAVSNLSTVAAPFTSFVSYAEDEDWTIDLTGLTTQNFMLDKSTSQGKVYDVDENAKKITIPSVIYKGTNIVSGDKLQVFASVNGNAPIALTGDYDYQVKDTVIYTESKEYIVDDRGGDTLVISATYTPLQGSPITKELATINILDEATAEDIAEYIEFDCNDDAVATIAEPVTATFEDNASGKFVRNDATFSIVLDESIKEGVDVTESQTAIGWGSEGNSPKSAFTAAIINDVVVVGDDFTVALKYDPDGLGDSSSADAEVVKTKTITVHPSNLAKELAVTEGTGSDAYISWNTNTSTKQGTIKLDATREYKRKADSNGTPELSWVLATPEEYKKLINNIESGVSTNPIVQANNNEKAGIKWTVSTGLSEDKLISTETATIEAVASVEPGTYKMLVSESAGLTGTTLPTGFGKDSFLVADVVVTSAEGYGFTFGTGIDDETGNVMVPGTIAYNDEPITLNAYVSGEDGYELVPVSDKKVTWYCDDPNVATIGKDTGVVTPIKDGTIEVTATYTTATGETIPVTKEFTVTADKVTVEASIEQIPFGGSIIVGDEISLTAENLIGEDVTKTDKFEWTITTGTGDDEEETEDAAIKENVFKATKAGTYNVYAKYVNKAGTSVTSTALTIPVGLGKIFVSRSNGGDAYVSEAESLEVYTGETVPLLVKYGRSAYMGENVTAKDTTYESSNEKVATVSDTGVISTVAEGKAVITISNPNASNKVELSLFVTEKDEDEAGAKYEILDEDGNNEITLYSVGDKINLNLYKRGKLLDTNRVIWETSDSDVATVTSKGVVKVVGRGTAEISVSEVLVGDDVNITDKFGVYTIHAYHEDQVVLTYNGSDVGDVDSLNAFNKRRYKATVKGVEVPGTWGYNYGDNDFEQEADVQISQDGTVTALDEGEVYITFTADNPQYLGGKFTLTVNTASLSFGEAGNGYYGGLSLQPGQTYQLKTYNGTEDVTTSTTFRSTNTEFVTVDVRGLVTAIKAIPRGTTVQIEATNELLGLTGEKKATIAVRVSENASAFGIYINDDIDELRVGGESAVIKAEVVPVGPSITWTTEDTDIVELTDNQDGTATIKPLAVGTATLTAKSGDVFATYKAEVLVSEDQQKIEDAAVDAAANAVEKPTAQNIKELEDAIEAATEAGADEELVEALNASLTNAKVAYAANLAEDAEEDPSEKNVNALVNAIAAAKEAGATDKDLEETTAACERATALKAVNDAVDAAEVPSAENIDALTAAIADAEKLGIATEKLNGAKDALITAQSEQGAYESGVDALKACADAYDDPTEANITELKDAITHAKKSGVDAEIIEALETGLEQAEAIKAVNEAKAEIDAAVAQGKEPTEEQVKALEDAIAKADSVGITDSRINKANATVRTELNNEKTATEQKAAADVKAANDKAAAAEQKATTAEQKATAAEQKAAAEFETLKKAKAANGYVVNTFKSGEATLVSIPANKTKATFTIASKVKVNGKTYKVTKIAAKALKTNTKIKTLTVPATVKQIGANAFGSKVTKLTVKGSNVQVLNNALKSINKKAKVIAKNKYTRTQLQTFGNAKKTVTFSAK